MSLTIPQVLDLLMALVLVMFIPIGLWRGALREWIALAGVMLGYMLAMEWSAPWGSDLATLAALDPRVAHFTVAAGFFLGVTLLVGYGAGVVLPFRPDLSWSNRLLGAVLGLGNGLLILSFALRIMQHNLFSDAGDSPLRVSILAVVLIDYVGWVQLGLLIIFLVSVLTGLIGRWSDRPALFDEYVPVYYSEQDEAFDQPMLAWQEHQPDARYAYGDDDGEPYRVPRSAAPPAPPLREQAADDAPHAQDTAVLHPITPIVIREVIETSTEEEPVAAGEVDRHRQEGDAADDDEATPPKGTPAISVMTKAAPPNGHAEPAPAAGTPQPAPEPSRVRVIDIARPTAQPEVQAALLVDQREAGVADHQASPGGVPLDGDDEPVNGEIACGICGTPAAAKARFCEICGHLIGQVERRTVARFH